MKYCRNICCILICLSIISCSDHHSIRLGVTTTLEDSGLLAELITAFEQEHAISIKPIVASSGQIHHLIERGDIDTAITHDPDREKQLLTKGIIKQRIPLMQNDFLIVGPRSDPAHIQHALTPDEAFEKIINTNNIFISRNDQSGTHTMELHWWKKAKLTPPDLYYIKTGTGMGATLAVTVERQGYTLTDRGTWLNFANKQNLTVLFENPDLLPNQYSLLSLPKEKAQTWEKWLVGDTAQQLILNYRIENKTTFFNIKR